jgi:hypothetical protein
MTDLGKIDQVFTLAPLIVNMWKLGKRAVFAGVF